MQPRIPSFTHSPQSNPAARGKPSPLTACSIPLLILLASSAAAASQPNILWIVLEDISPELGCYGFDYAVTSSLDAFAAESVLYTQAFSNGGACAPARSTLITGMYPPAIGTHHMRSEGVPPAFVRGFTEYFREAGYYTSNHSKTDYNWIQPDSTWDVVAPDWRTRGWAGRGDKPFFTVVNITDTHSSQTYHAWAGWPERRAALSAAERHDPARAIVPPYYPDTPQTREILARYADNITYADRIVGEVLERLERDGLADDTIVFFYSDHGTGLPRSKGFQFESSTRVPLMVRFPRKFGHLAPAAPGSRLDRMVAFVDFAPTVLSLAGVRIPEHFHGQAFLGEAAGGQSEYIFGYRDRMDERYEFIRSVRSARLRYIRNYFPHLPWFHGQTRIYPSLNPLLEIWHRLSKASKLAGPAALYMADTKPREQLFDVREDPDEIRDLAQDPRYAGRLAELRGVLRDWIMRHRDLGFVPEEDMWLRFDGRPPYDEVRSEDVYPLMRIVETADSVGLGPTVLQAQLERLGDVDPTVRFWAATGIEAQGPAGRPARPALRVALRDRSHAVQTAAARALCGLGDCEAALEVLVGNLEHENQYVSLRAANALHHLGDRARPVLPEMRKFLGNTGALDFREFMRATTWSHKVLRQAVRELANVA